MPIRTSQTERILTMHDEFVPPEGFQAEVIEGNLVISPPRSARHSQIHDDLHAQLRRLLPTDLALTSTTTLETATTGERYVPDILAVAKKLLDSGEPVLPAGRATLVVEIVSSFSGYHDRVVKLPGYAASGVPIYVLVDPLERSTTLFFEPAGETYRHMLRVPFGASVALPEPYQGKIDTGAFT